MIYGYARVSTKGQSRNGFGIDVQIGKLKKFGCEKIFCETYSGKELFRPQLNQLMCELKTGDMLVVTNIDRLSRDLLNGIRILKNIFNIGVKVYSLDIGIVTNSLTENLYLIEKLYLAQVERDTVVERTQAGRAIARQDPNYREGRPKKYNQQQLDDALDLLSNGNSYRSVERKTGISKSTLIREKRKRNCGNTTAENCAPLCIDS